MKLKFGIILCVAIVTLNSCNNNNETEKEEVEVTRLDSTKEVITDEKLEQPVISMDSSLTLLSKEALLLLKNKEYSAFAKFLHPEGCLFSPYGYIDSTKAILLTEADFSKLLNDGKQLNWGSYDGSGEPIDLSLKAYIDKFIYNADYLNAEKFSVNKILGSGNSLNNLKKVFPDLNFTESYFSGFKKEYRGMDWTSLRFVFKKSGDKFYIRAVVHDQWTS